MKSGIVIMSEDNNMTVFSGFGLWGIILASIPILIIFIWKIIKNPVPPADVNNERDPKVDIARQGFSSEKVPKNLDIIVIGSGMGGLTTAAIMAKEGKRVLVLEQHDVAGGNTHTFVEQGFEFDTGLHYVGGSLGNKKRLLRKKFDYITDGNLDWVRMNDVYDKAVVHNTDGTNETFDINSDWKVLIPYLKSAFPHDIKAIDKHFDLISQIDRTMPLFGFMMILPAWLKSMIYPFVSGKMKIFQKTTSEVLKSLTSNKKLIGVLSYMYGDYGETLDRSAFFVNSLLWSHYRGGAYYPVGGPSAIAQCIIPVIEKWGGKVLVRAPVSSIVIDDSNKAVGVEVKGNIIYAPVIVSSVGAPLTYKKLIPETKHHLLQRQLKGLSNPKVTGAISLMSLFIGLDGTTEELNLPNQNFWVYPSWDHEENWKKFQADSTNFCAVFMSFSSAKDPTYADRYPNKQVALVIAPNLFKEVEKFQNERVKKRGVEYNQLKFQWEEKLLEIFCRQFPHLEDKITFKELGTAITNDYYLGTYQGAVYGLGHTSERYNQSWLGPKTPIKNLYLTGQDIVSCGIAGATSAGFLTAATISKKSLIRIGSLMG